jgi:hypothetical protein
MSNNLGRWAIALVLAAGAALSGSPARAEDPPACGDDPSCARPRGVKAIWVPSLVVWSTVYVATISTTGAINAAHDYPHRTTAEAAIPLFGPWVMLGDHKNHITGLHTGLTALSRVLQTLGFVGVVVGATLETGGSQGRASLRWTMTPEVGPSRAGVAPTVVGF